MAQPHRSGLRLPKPNSGGTTDLIDQGGNCMGPCSSLPLLPKWGMRCSQPANDNSYISHSSMTTFLARLSNLLPAFCWDLFSVDVSLKANGA